MRNELLHYENVCFRRDGRHILDNVNWHIEEGEHWALLGLNGAGKSTLVKTIVGELFPSQHDTSLSNSNDRHLACLWS